MEEIDEEELTPAPKKTKKSPKTSTPATFAVKPVPLSTFSSITSSLKTSKSLKIEPFDMLKDDPGLWIGSFEKALEVHGPIDDIAFPTLFHLLDDDGQAWHFQYRRKNRIIIWSELKDDFVEIMQKRFVKKLGDLKKSYVDNESVENYVQEQFNLYKSFFQKLTEKELILAAMAGLPQAYKLELIEYKDVKAFVFLSFCQFIDKANKAIQDPENEAQTEPEDV